MNRRSILRSIYIVTVSGLLSWIPVASFAQTTTSTTTTAPATISTPINLNVRIPGLTLSQTAPIEDGEAAIPLFAQYISGIYRYLLGISMVIGAIMIVYGGFLYIIGSSTSSVKRGREVITNTGIGLGLLFGIWTILYTINPELTSLQPLRLTLVKPDPQSYMGGRYDAPQTLTELGIQAASGAGKNLAIPAECPGRDKSYSEPQTMDRFFYVAGQSLSKKNYAICSQGKCLDQKTIDFYLAEQKRTGVPAAVIMAQVANEAGMGAVFNLANGGPSSIFYNYGGIGCTKARVPDGACPHVAFGSMAFENGTKKPHPVGCAVFNGGKELGQTCINLCFTSSRDTYTDCGEECYPQKSHASVIDKASGKELWIPSVQCSRKFKNPQEFLDTHLSFVKPCLPFSDSVYKFAYCIGASSYAGVTGAKGQILAEIIERNCLCDPKTDSLGCVRNKELEEKLSRNIIKKRNLYDKQFYTNGEPNQRAIVEALFTSTQGLLRVGEQLPQNDILIPPDHN